MMTFLVSWQLFQKHYPENTTIDIKVPKYCTQVTGTTAFLRKKDTLTLHQLFYALLLPSGNDAALVLADYFGGVIQSKNETLVVPKSYMFPENMPIRYFLREMNITASKIGMTNTTFDCPHGLSNNFNVSTALDVAILSYQCMQNDVFTTVVKTPFYEVETELAVYEWQNTNRLLGYDFDSEDTVPLFHGTLGCKTGITPSAGPCFAGYFSRYDNDQVEPDNCIVIVLNSKSMEARWVEVPALVKWY
jgi:D-alanyl-D-alanine carboxypeptidase